MRARLFKSNGRWVVAEFVHEWPATGGRLYQVKAEGASPKEAYDRAFPCTLWKRVQAFLSRPMTRHQFDAMLAMSGIRQKGTP